MAHRGQETAPVPNEVGDRRLGVTKIGDVLKDEQGQRRRLQPPCCDLEQIGPDVAFAFGSASPLRIVDETCDGSDGSDVEDFFETATHCRDPAVEGRFDPIRGAQLEVVVNGDDGLG